MHLAGLALLAVFILAQVPAVLYLGRYFEREADDSPTRRFWREGGPRERGDDDPRVEREGTHAGASESPDAVGVSDPAAGTTGRHHEPPGTGGSGQGTADGVEAIPAAEAADATRERRRCPTCGADNHPEYAYCHGCLSELPPGDEF